MNDTMLAVVQDSLGGPEVLHVAEVARPVPGIGQVLVAVRAAGVNPADQLNRSTGIFSGPPPFTLGWDISGVVAAVGPGVTIWQPGDEVFGLLPFPVGAGGYAEYAVAPARALVRVPSGLSHEEAAALPLAGLTAWQALVETAEVTAGSRVLVIGAAGGVGHLAVQIAHARGATVTAVGSAGQEDLVRGLGAAEFVDRDAVDFADVVADVDVVLDVVGGDTLVRSVGTVRPGGIVVTTLPQALPAAVPAATAAGVRLAGLFVESDRSGVAALVDLVEAGALRPVIAARYPLAQAGAAQAGPHGPGKVVLTV